MLIIEMIEGDWEFLYLRVFRFKTINKRFIKW